MEVYSWKKYRTQREISRWCGCLAKGQMSSEQSPKRYVLIHQDGSDLAASTEIDFYTAMGQTYWTTRKLVKIIKVINVVIWVCLKMVSTPKKTMVLLIIISRFLMAISLGILTQHFQTNPYVVRQF